MPNLVLTPEAPVTPDFDVTLTLTATGPVNPVAGCGFQFYAEDDGGFVTQGPGVGEYWDERVRNIIYLWDYGDASPIVLDPEEYKALEPFQRNTAQSVGRIGGHWYTTAQNPLVRCWAYEMVAPYRTGYGELQLSIADQDSVYPDAQKYFWDPDADYTDCPAGIAGGRRYSDFDAMVTAVKAANQNAMVIMNNGKTLTRLSAAGTRINWGNFTKSLYWKSLNVNGTRPVVSFAAGGVTTNSSNSYGIKMQNDATGVLDVTIAGIDFYSPFRNDGANGTFAAGGGIDSGSPGYFSVHRCRMDGFDINGFGGTAGRAVILSQMYVGIIRQYGTFISNSRCCLLACQYIPDLTDWTGNGNQEGAGARFGGIDRVCILNCEFVGRYGNAGGAVTGIQGPLRLGTNNNPGRESVVCWSYMEGQGPNMSQNSGVPVREMGGVFMFGSRTAHTARGASMVSTEAGGATLYCNLLAEPLIGTSPAPDISRPGGSVPKGFLATAISNTLNDTNTGTGSSTGNRNAPTTFQSNTCYNEGTASIAETFQSGYAGPLSAGNNLLYASLQGIGTSYLPLDTTATATPYDNVTEFGFISARYDDDPGATGYDANVPNSSGYHASVPFHEWQLPVDFLKPLQPQSGSAAIGGASAAEGYPLPFDAALNPRNGWSATTNLWSPGGTWARGWLEPA